MPKNVIFTAKTKTRPGNQSDQAAKALQATSDLAAYTSQPIYTLSSVFPFDFFPDTITIDLKKIDISYGYFFLSRQNFSILISDLKTVRVNTGPFFATMYFEISGYETNPDAVTHLPKAKALRARSLIMGLLAFQSRQPNSFILESENVDLRGLPPNELVNQLVKIGEEEASSVSPF